MVKRPTRLQHRRQWAQWLTRSAAIAVIVTLSGCGSATEPATDSPSAVSTAPDGTTFNGADVEFATQMIPHHAQAVQMVVMAQGRDLDPKVATLMEDIRTAQVPEIQSMTGWLSTWGEPIPETAIDHSNAHSDESGVGSAPEGMSDMPGMMSDADMEELDASSGRDFETMWLTMMEAHHEGAISMARTEVEQGENPEVVALAEAIIESQSAEIKLIETLRR